MIITHNLTFIFIRQLNDSLILSHHLTSNSNLYFESGQCDNMNHFELYTSSGNCVLTTLLLYCLFLMPFRLYLEYVSQPCQPTGKSDRCDRRSILELPQQLYFLFYFYLNYWFLWLFDFGYAQYVFPFRISIFFSFTIYLFCLDSWLLTLILNCQLYIICLASCF